ncbi:MAG: hypothetical protein ATN36_03110 [Epulopiscium sp. Nele67-Bin005]|nr:MAG: hypothetical protein ATN36_03110 [Epulopiscium sp. Nele67-Bin005]
MNSKSISTRLALRVTAIVTITLAILIGMSVMQSMSAIQTTIDLEFSVIAEQNSVLVQNMVEANYTLIENMSEYMIDVYAEIDRATPVFYEEDEVQPHMISEIYGTPLTNEIYLAEHFLLNSALQAVTSENTGIEEIGVYFEPYAFDKNTEGYGFHMVLDDLNVGRSYEQMNSYNEYRNEPFYAKTIETRQPQIFMPEYNQRADLYLSNISVPIIYDNEVKGVIVAKIIISRFGQAKVSDEHYPSMAWVILSDDLVRVYDSIDPTRILDLFTDNLDEKSTQLLHNTIRGDDDTFIIQTSTVDGDRYMRYFAPIQVLGDTWWSMVRLDMSDYQKSAQQIAYVLVVIAMIAIVWLIIAVNTLIRGMLRPIKRVVEAAKSIAEGNLDVDVEYRGEDEIGELASTFRMMTRNLKAIINEADITLSEIAAGDLTTTAYLKAEYPGAYAPIKISMLEITDMLTSALTKINVATDSVTVGAGSIAEGATELAEGSNEQASIIEEFITNTQSIGQSINSMSDQVEATTKLSEDAKARADRGTHAMTAMVNSMQQINESSLVIAEVLKTVDDIAAQTNLLALNASIESARAGEAGKGFAVVATEIRELSNKSSETVKEIEAIIKQSIAHVNEGQRKAHETEESLNEIVEAVQGTSEFFEELVQATQSQKASISHLLAGTQQISAVVQTNSATSQQSAAISDQLAKEASQLQNLLHYFKYNN